MLASRASLVTFGATALFAAVAVAAIGFAPTAQAEMETEAPAGHAADEAGDPLPLPSRAPAAGHAAADALRGDATAPLTRGLGDLPAVAAAPEDATAQAADAREEATGTAAGAAESATTKATEAKDAATSAMGEAMGESMGDAMGEAPGEKPDMPDVAAPAPSETAGDAETTPDSPGSPDSPSCLDLVAAGKFAEAVPACTEALQVDPDNPALQTALETAKSKLGTASEGGGLQDAATSALGDMMKKGAEEAPSSE